MNVQRETRASAPQHLADDATAAASGLRDPSRAALRGMSFGAGEAALSPGSGGSGQAPVQCYRKMESGAGKETPYGGLNALLRVSDDGRMATPDPGEGSGTHVFYAEQSIISSANSTLKGLKSPVSVRAGGGSITGRKNHRKKSPITLKEVVPANARTETEGDGMKSYEGCNMNAWETMGALAEGQKSIKRAGKGMDPLRFDTTSRDHMLPVGDVRSEIAKRELGRKPEGKEESKEVYGELDEKTRSKYAKKLGINQHAAPTKVGQSLQVARASGSQGKDPFLMHWAPVVAKAGGDYVTLENFGRSNSERKEGDTNLASSDWHFRMYGPANRKGSNPFGKGEDQSYHAEHKAEFGGDDNAMTLLYDTEEAKDK
ncbi:MAG: hypothetical protein H6745_16960 [Deltaproteobacteria bacterium]|nr:hypothetical protein [Deltaproteobacteria bacterium]